MSILYRLPLQAESRRNERLAGIGLAAGLTKSSEGLGAVGLTAALGDYTNLGGTLMVFSL
jgi:hypothetical protein